jgi:flagellar biosynthesis protein FlhG
MLDQANDLRRLARQSGFRPARASASTLTPAPPRPKLIVVTSGKGGVGTTTIAVNLAVAIAQQGFKTVLADTDPNSAATATLCRIEERFTIADLIASRRTIDEVLQPGPGGIRVLPGTWGLTQPQDHTANDHERFIKQLVGLGDAAQMVVLDVGNQANRSVRRFWQAADSILLVTTPDITSVMNSYAAIKLLSPGLGRISVRPIVNMANQQSVADDVHTRLYRACTRFLAYRPESAMFVPEDPYVPAAARRSESFVLAAPNGPASRQINRLALALLGATMPGARGATAATEGERLKALLLKRA